MSSLSRKLSSSFHEYHKRLREDKGSDARNINGTECVHHLQRQHLYFPLLSDEATGRTQNAASANKINGEAVKKLQRKYATCLSKIATRLDPTGAFWVPINVAELPNYDVLIPSPLDWYTISHRIHVGYYTTTAHTEGADGDARLSDYLFEDDVFQVLSNAVAYHGQGSVLAAEARRIIKGLYVDQNACDSGTQPNAEHAAVKPEQQPQGLFPACGVHTLRYVTAPITALLSPFPSKAGQLLPVLQIRAAQQATMLAFLSIALSFVRQPQMVGLPVSLSSAVLSLSDQLVALHNEGTIFTGAQRGLRLATKTYNIDVTESLFVDAAVSSWALQVPRTGPGCYQQYMPLHALATSVLNSVSLSPCVSICSAPVMNTVSHLLREVDSLCVDMLSVLPSITKKGSGETEILHLHKHRVAQFRRFLSPAMSQALAAQIFFHQERAQKNREGLEDIVALSAVDHNREKEKAVLLHVSTRLQKMSSRRDGDMKAMLQRLSAQHPDLNIDAVCSRVKEKMMPKVLAVIEALLESDTERIFHFPVLSPVEYVETIASSMCFTLMLYKSRHHLYFPKLHISTVGTNIIPPENDRQHINDEEVASPGFQAVFEEIRTTLSAIVATSIIHDMDIMVDNCIVYNGPTHPFSQTVTSLRSKLPDIIRRASL